MARMKADARRLELLETAARCFGEHGYRGTTTAMLAKAAGVTVPILYRHFADKRDLFLALIDSVGQKALSEWREAARRTPSPLGQLREVLYHNPALADPTAQRVYQIMIHASTEFTEPQMISAIRGYYRKYLRILAKTIRLGQKAGEIRDDIDADTLAWELAHLVVGFAVIRWVDLPGHKEPGFVDKTVGGIVAMLAKNPKPGSS